ncbi:MAG: hypothetical protein KatS3mg108_1841 [Isosphaeraceae bacterium]|jgi:tetratricopeptide (TPR) repeat protein|nr:MAG: hypothetical protein KatS3mg108_1841 [Isosphaeraceae bacterium]
MTPSKPTEAGVAITPPEGNGPELPARESEPWTPERVLAWNRYLDRYVAGGVLVLVFLVALRPIGHTSIWPLLKAGQVIAQGGPITRDVFSYTREGQTWVNVPWLFEVVGAQVYGLAERLFRSDTDPERGRWAGASALVLMHAGLLTLAAWLLMQLRRPGPGLWWSAIAAMVALGGFVTPAAVQGRWVQLGLGGLAHGFDAVTPECWGLVWLAVGMVLLHAWSNLGRRWAAWALPAVFLVWANSSETVGFGLIVAAVWTLGLLAEAGIRRRREAVTVRPAQALGVLGGSVLVCLLNPSTYRLFEEALVPIGKSVIRLAGGGGDEVLTQDQLGFFGPISDREFGLLGDQAALAVRLFYGFVVWLGLISFVLNYRNFRWSRFLAYLAAVVMWAGRIQWAPFVGLVLAGVLSLNGQEWYLGRYGAEGRVGMGWKLWSDGGRAVTILGIFALCFLAITGYASRPGDPRFGLGYDDSNLAVDAARFLRSLPLEGRVLNLTPSHGDALIWEAPERKPFIDNRRGLYDQEIRRDLQAIRSALLDDDRSRWEPLLSRYGGEGAGITAVMVNPSRRDAPVYNAMLSSSSWVRLYDGGNAVVFGRADAPSKDVTVFRDQRLDAAKVVYGRYDPQASPDRPPAGTSWLDHILRYRAVQPPRPPIYAADRWLDAARTAPEPDPALALMAIREARRVLARDPDDYLGHLILQNAYLTLTNAELAILDRGRPTDRPAVEPIEHINFRYRQRLAEMRFAIETAPPPRARGDREARADRYVELGQLYESNRALDLARDAYVAARKLVSPGTFPEALEERIAQIDEQIERLRAGLEERAAAGLTNPIQRADYLVSAGFPGLALEELLAAENLGISPAAVRWSLVDLYCQTGQPDKAYDLLEATGIGDPSLSTGPGTAAYRQGLVNLLLGYHTYAANYWENYALPPVRQAAVGQALEAAIGVLRGEPVAATRTVLDITGVPGSPGYLDNEAQWEAELGLCLLEAGIPQDVLEEDGTVRQTGAATHFRRALEINPQHPIRALLVYYLERLGQPVPSEPGDPQTGAAAAPSATAFPESSPAPPSAPPASGSAASNDEARPSDPAGPVEPVEPRETAPAVEVEAAPAAETRPQSAEPGERRS